MSRSEDLRFLTRNISTDYSGSWDKIAHHQANVHNGPISTDMATKWYMNQGIERHKIVIGMRPASNPPAISSLM